MQTIWDSILQAPRVLGRCTDHEPLVERNCLRGQTESVKRQIRVLVVDVLQISQRC